MAAPEIDIDRIPAALRERAQWLVWRFESKQGESKPRKVPYYANGARRTGQQASPLLTHPESILDAVPAKWLDAILSAA